MISERIYREWNKTKTSELVLGPANLWSICSKRFDFMVYTFICAFWKIKFFWLLGPSKSSGDLKKDQNFGFLTFEYALKNYALSQPFWNFCPVSNGHETWETLFEFQFYLFLFVVFWSEVWAPWVLFLPLKYKYKKQIRNYFITYFCDELKELSNIDSES